MSKLKFTVISGTTGVTENMYVYEYNDSMIIVDCGVGFPDIEMQGVDLVIPDFSYIKKNKNILKAIFVSQGHEDHVGALPFLLREVNVHIYAPKLVAALVSDKLEEHGINADIRVYNPDTDNLRVGPFVITPFRVAHSIPDTVGFSIDTPEGRIMHVAEHKFDPHPVDRQTFDIKKVKDLSSKGVLMLASDCLGVNREGTTESEIGIEKRLLKIMRKAKGQIFFTTISSNIGRIQQVINSSRRLRKKVAFLGRSIERKSMIAKELGYLKFDVRDVLERRDMKKVKEDRRVFIVAGCYGQVGSALFRLSTDDRRDFDVRKGDAVIFSANPSPPYTKESIDFIVDNFIDMGADVHYYDLNEGLYVSGHGSRDDIIRLFDLVRPKFYLPLGGTVRFMHGYKKLLMSRGVDERNILTLKPGNSVSFENGNVVSQDKVPAREILVDGLGIGDVGKVVLQDRKALGEQGVVIALIELTGDGGRLQKDPEIISRGFVFQKQEKNFLKRSGRLLRQRIERSGKSRMRDVKFLSADFLTQHFLKEIGRRPMVIPVVVEG